MKKPATRHPRQSAFVRLLAAACAAIILVGSPGRPPAAQAAPASTIVVNAGGDSAACGELSFTLRCAIVYANANPGTWIRFAPGLAAVTLQSQLPIITGDFTWIDGHDIVTNACVCPRIDGAALTSGSSGLVINASFVTISNMAIVNLPFADIYIIGGKDIEISYNQLGILAGATACNGYEVGDGVRVENVNPGGPGFDNGVAYIFGNTISCHNGWGVSVINSNYVYIGEGRQGAVLGNLIGTTSDGLHAAGNSFGGVLISTSNQVTVRSNLIANNLYGLYVSGNEVQVRDNRLADNGGPGVWLTMGTGQSIVGNKIGTTADGLHAAPNAEEGILVSGGSGIIMANNLVAYNGKAGIAVTGDTTHVTIQNDEIRDNGGLPIDLGNDGASGNGTHSLPGPNNWLAYPVVTAFSGSHVEGTTCPYCTVRIFRVRGNPAAPGGGGLYLTTVFAGLVGSAGDWAVTLPSGLTRLDVTLTASDSSGNTSEMSPRPQLLLPLIVR